MTSPLAARIRRAIGGFYDAMPLKRPLMSVLRPFGVPEPLYRHLHFRGAFSLRVPGAPTPLRIYHSGTEIENELFWEGLPGRREGTSMALWMLLAREASVVFDVGANVGTYALVAQALSPSAAVFAFEPLPELYDVLSMNCRLNGFPIVAEPMAVSDVDGQAPLFVPEGPAPSGASLMAPSGGTLPTRTVATCRLSTIVEKHRLQRIDLMKLDVEGAETAVLRGLGEGLQRFIPDMLVEILTAEAARDLEEILRPLRYVFFDVDDRGLARRVDRLARSSHWNYLVCRPETASRLLALGRLPVRGSHVVRD